MTTVQHDGHGKPRGDGHLSPGAGRLVGGVAWRGVVAAVVVAAPGMVSGQETTELLTTRLPYPAYQPVQRDHYDHHIGPVGVRYDLGTSFTFTDNRNYNSEGKGSDFGLEAQLNLGFFYRVSEESALQLDVGVGYMWWQEVTSQNGVYFAPDSHLTYGFSLGNVRIRIANTTATSSRASDRAEFAGGTSQSNIAFNQLDNTSSIAASWGPGRVRVSGNYAFILTRSLTDQFTSLDRDSHDFGATVLAQVTTPIAVGVYADYSIYQYQEKIQNDGDRFSVGPTVEWSPTDYLVATARVGYTVSNYQTSGSIQDATDFSGMTFDVSVDYRMNRYLAHSVFFRKGVDPGYTANFTESYEVGYNLHVNLGPDLHPYLGFQYENATISGSTGEVADLYDVSVGVGYPLLRRLMTGVGYSVRFRSSNLENRDYLENRVTLTASYQF